MTKTETVKSELISIQKLNGFRGHDFNPKSLIKIVNDLINDGFEQSIHKLETYHTISSGNYRITDIENILLIALLLFDPIEGKTMPKFSLGRSDVEQPSQGIDLFPVMIYEDIPFIITGGYDVGGELQPPYEFLRWCKFNCSLRSKYLMPPNNPLEVVDDFLNLKVFKQMNYSRYHCSMIRLQALRMLDNIFRLNEKEEQEFITIDDNTEIWERIKNKFQLLKIFWDAGSNDYKMQYPQ